MISYIYINIFYHAKYRNNNGWLGRRHQGKRIFMVHAALVECRSIMRHIIIIIIQTHTVTVVTGNLVTTILISAEYNNIFTWQWAIDVCTYVEVARSSFTEAVVEYSKGNVRW